ncbi:MAG: hypothetical protein AAF360_02970 [Pseudomonadota bacterium]
MPNAPADAIISTMARLSILSAVAPGAGIMIFALSGALLLSAGPTSAQPAAELGAAPEAAPILNETREETLIRLHEALTASADEDAARIAQEIQSLWSRSGSDSMDLLLQRGRRALEEKAFEKASAHLSALTRLAPDFAEGWNALATMHYLNEDYGLAVDHIQRVLALEPRHFSALSGLALTLEQVGRKQAALSAWREVESLYPSLENAKKAIERLAPEVDGREL